MRKSCAKVVDAFRKIVEAEHHLYSAIHYLPKQHVVNSSSFPSPTHTFSIIRSTAKNVQLNLLITKLSTLYTGLITNITKYTFSFNS